MVEYENEMRWDEIDRFEITTKKPDKYRPRFSWEERIRKREKVRKRAI